MGLIFVKTQDGAKKVSFFVWVLLVVIGGGLLIWLLFSNRQPGLNQLTDSGPPTVKDASAPIQTNETLKTRTSSVDAETENAIQKQIEYERDQGGGFLPEERIKAIREKHTKEYEEKTATAFRTNQKDRISLLKEQMAPPPPPTTNTPTKNENKSAKYQTFAERMGNQGGGGGGGGSRSFEARGGPQNNPNDPNNANNPNRRLPSTGINLPNQRNDFQNMLPLGTYIPCILESDVITTDLASKVWATVALDVTFRRQLQLPKGLVRARGTAATQPVQDMVDISFDTLVFSDGTELPISGAAYTALDPRYPNRYKTRGIPGDLIKPPLYLKLQALLYGAAIGASDAYVQNFINENTETTSTFTTVPVVDPTTGTVTNQIQQTQRPPVNTNIGQTLGLSAAQSTLTQLLEMAKSDLEKYRPYVIVEKGTPFYIQIDSTVDISRRQINGVAIAAAEAEAQGRGVPRQRIFGPGDARSVYDDGVIGTTVNPNQQAMEQQTAAYLNRLQNISGLNSVSGERPQTTANPPANPQSTNAQRPNQNAQMLDQLLQSLRTPQ